MQFIKRCVVFVLTLEAKAVLARHKPRVIAVTGSVGKTTTKDAIYAALSSDLYIRKSAKSFNSEIGVPLTVLGLENAWNDPLKWATNLLRGLIVAVGSTYPDTLVLEVGADRPGDIRRVAAWIRPDIAVITGVPDIPVHVEYFSSPDEVFKEKRALAEYLKPGGKLIVNGDDLRMRSLHASYRGICVTYGLGEDNDYYASHEEIAYADSMPTGERFRANHAGFSLPVSIEGTLGRPRILAVLAAIAVGEHAGVDAVSAARGLATWEPPQGRVRILPGVSGSVVIDDTYNSSPVAALAALDILAEIKAKRRIAILGDMLELGRYSKDAHKQVGERAGTIVDMLVTVGFRSRAMGEAALDAGLSGDAVREYELGESVRAGEELMGEVMPGDVILVKGSQSIRMEKTVKLLMAQPERASELLVRQDPEWLDRS
jgi:UDP-N-acetylmuramyl pentapeptide synthase